MGLRSVIIDDEQRGRENLKNLLSVYCPGVTLVGEANSVLTGLKIINQQQPDLIFLDIEMPGGSGFDLLRSIDPSRTVEVIFVTAYDTYGIPAIKACAVDYLLKPIHITDLMEAVGKARDQVTSRRENKRLKELVDNFGRKTDEQRIALPLTDRTLFVPIRQIIRIEASGNYSHICLENQQAHLVCKTLKGFQEILEDKGFIRTHQSHLINISRIDSYIKRDGGCLKMEDGSMIPISRQRRDEVARLLRLMAPEPSHDR